MMPAKLTTLLLLSAFAFYAPIQAQTPRFIPGPDPAKTWNIGEYGPTGLELSLDPGFTMRVTGVINGSPAALSGQISVNQIIESINGVALDVATDPRFTLGDIITNAEASDGVLALQIRDAGEVTINIPVLGAYSATWPVNCPKSDAIVNNLAELIASQAQPNWGSIIFLLSTGDDSYLPVIGNWIANKGSLGAYPWHYGMAGLGVCEYYLRTGDSNAIPLIQEGADRLRELMYVGGWSGRGYASITYSTGSGHLNAAGVPAATFLLLAKLCGVNVDEHTLQESLKNFYRYAGHDNVGYGNNWPEGGFRDNGKTSALAFTMQAAARLDPAGENSIYVRARDISSMKAFYANPWFNRAHPGGGYGEMWHAMAMGLIHDKRPDQYRNYMDARRWHFELSRYHNGGIGISDGGGSHDFDKATGTENDWGTFYALAYTIPRKKLILFGASLTEFCVPYDLPERPWGTAADEAFLSMTPAMRPDGTVTDLSDERLGTHDSVALESKMDAADVTDEILMEFARHIDHGIRTAAAKRIVSQGRNNLLLPLLQSNDPRVRHTGLLTITGMFKGNSFALSNISQDAINEVKSILEDPNESLWVRMHAAQALARFGATTIGAHKATLLAMLGHEDWWVQDSAGRALREIIAENAHYQDVIPPMAKFSCEIPVVNLLWGYAYTQSSMMKKLASAPKPIRDFAADYFVQEHADNPVIMQGPGGHVVTQGATYINDWLGQGADKLLDPDPMPRAMALSTVTFRKTLDEADQLNYHGQFIYDPGMATTWKHVTKLSNPDSLGDVIDGGPPPSSAPDITFADGGFIEGEAGAVWTEGYYIDLFRREAREVLKRQHNGEYYLLIERGTFDAVSNPDPNWHPGYDAYVRKLEDNDPPTPDPMTFAVAPTGIGPMAVGMVAATAIDASEPVEYYFDNTNSDIRDWSTDPTWYNTGLVAGTYGYRVKARDGEGNETAWSDVVYGSPGDDTTKPFPNPMTFARPPTAKSLDSITMTASPALDFSGVEYYFACTGGGGPDSGWQDSPAFTPTGLTTGSSYTYVVRARDKSTARNTTADSGPASAAPEAVTDITPPLIALLNPANNASGIATNASLVLAFDEEIAAGTGSITIKNLTDSTETGMAITDAQVVISGTTVTINPSGGFIEGRTYAIRITEGAITDLAANAFPGITNDAIWQFTIGDPNPPMIQWLSPVDEKTDVSPSADLSIVFNEPVEVGTGNVTIKNLTDDTQMEIDITDGDQVTVSGSTLTINPTGRLGVGKRYAVQIDATAIDDLAGNRFGGITDDTTWNFTIWLNPLLEPGHPLIPAGIGPGDSFHFVFVTSSRSTRVGEPTTHPENINHYNDIVNGVAGGSSLALVGDLRWKALVSTPDVDARDNARVVAPVHRLDKELVATGFDDIWDGTIAKEIMIQENGVPFNGGSGSDGGRVWSGSTSAGIASASNPMGTGGDALTGTARTGVTSSGWITSSSSARRGATANLFYYALSEVIAVAGTATGDTFVDWIGGFTDVGGQTGLDEDPDGDGVESGVENFFGTDPSKFSQGLLAGAASGNTFTFTHPQNPTPAADLTAAYRWSKDLANFHADGATDPAGTRVDFITQPDTPGPGITTVTASVAGTPVGRLFVTVQTTYNPTP